jgi:hypothetical protein
MYPPLYRHKQMEEWVSHMKLQEMARITNDQEYDRRERM